MVPELRYLGVVIAALALLLVLWLFLGSAGVELVPNNDEVEELGPEAGKPPWMKGGRP